MIPEIAELDALRQDFEGQLKSIERSLAESFAGIENIDAAELLKVEPLVLQLRKVLSLPKDYSIKGALAPTTRMLKILWNSPLPLFTKPAFVIMGGLLAFGAAREAIFLFLEAPIKTLFGVFIVGMGWRLVVRFLKKGDEREWRRAAKTGISTTIFMPAVQDGNGWHAVWKETGKAPYVSRCEPSLPDVHAGTVGIDIFADAKRTYVGAIHSNGKFYPPREFNFPVTITIPESIQSLYSRMRALPELVEKTLEVKATLQEIDTARQRLLTVHVAWKDIYIPDKLKLRLIQMLILFGNGDPAAPRGLLLYGPPGTGKTLIAKAIADSCEAAFFATSLPDFKMGHIGQSAQKVKSFWNEVRSTGRAIIFIDECEGVFGSRGSADSDSFTAEIVQTFLAEWDGLQTKGKAPDVWVIGATNRRELIDGAILSRFGQEIEIPLPNGAVRRNILEAELEAIGMPADWLPENTDKLTQGLSGRDLNRLATATRMAMLGDDAPTPEHLMVALGQMRKRGATVTDEEARWDTLVLDERTMKELKTVCGMLNHADALSKQGVAIPRGIIFHGPPGTGKTQIARTLANESGLNFIAATTGDVKASYLGQSGGKVKELFARVRSQSPAILFLDEVDIICPSRGASSDVFAQEIIGQLLQELDGVKATTEHVFVVAATNRLDSIDSAVLSRFPKRVEIPLPDLAARKQLLMIMLRKLKHTLTEEDICTMAEGTGGKSGRDLRSMVENAQNNAVARALENGEPTNVQLTPEDFEWGS